MKPRTQLDTSHGEHEASRKIELNGLFIKKPPTPNEGGGGFPPLGVLKEIRITEKYKSKDRVGAHTDHQCFEYSGRQRVTKDHVKRLSWSERFFTGP